MNPKDIVFIMNVDWNWIKQRPHFIAELLNENFKVHVMYQYRYHRSGLQQRKKTTLDIRPIYVLPRGDRFPRLSKLNQKIKCAAIKNEIRRTKAKILYLTFPDQADAIPCAFDGIVIYDCMDDHPAFIKSADKKQKIIRQEHALINRANLVLVSSENLIGKLKKRYGDVPEQKFHLIRNGYNGEVLELENIAYKEKNTCYTFSYFGTISSWFNFDYILRSLNDFPDIKYELYGPVAGAKIPENERIHYNGTVEHEKMLEHACKADCLIMPFYINEIIESVDPVKLYEYINFNKNILVPYYKEIERFEPFVYFYNTYEEFKAQIQALKSTQEFKYSSFEREAFLKENSWNNRVRNIEKLLSAEENILT